MSDILAGHFGPDVGRAMEDSFAELLFRLGYSVIVKCDQKTGLDVIAKFYGEPIDPKPQYTCALLPPFFAPRGIIAFSLKRSHFSKGDVDELISNVTKARKMEDPVFNSINGMVIASNFSLRESDIDGLLAKDVYCWDGRRLIFYSAKVRAIQNLSSRGPLIELAIGDLNQTSCLLEIETTEKLKNALLANVVVFIDDHNIELTVGAQHIEKILAFAYDQHLKQITERLKFDIQVSLTIHALGIVNETIVRNAYKKYTMETISHPKVFFPAEITIFQHGAAPWSILFK